MKYEEIRISLGSYEIELGKHDIIQPGKDENRKFYSVNVQYEKPDKPRDAYMAGYDKLLFENEDLRLIGKFSSHKEFDGKLLGVLLIRKAGDT
jgi:hypothetical protein